MALAQIVYVSRRHESLAPEVLEQLVGRSRARNAQRRITGVLIAGATHLMQLLEGDLHDIVELYETIRCDPRHGQVYCVVCKNVKRRMFPESGMELAVLESAGAALRERLGRLVRDAASMPEARRPGTEPAIALSTFRERLAAAA